MRKKREIDVIKDIEAMSEFLEEVHDDAQNLLKLLAELEELEQERTIARQDIQRINVETQVKLMDKLLEQYEYFQNDVDINGQRIKIIAEQLLQHAKNLDLADFKEKKKSWKF